jgi:tRNA threonylcarbamoyladenosine biosynthesis protein TsaB
MQNHLSAGTDIILALDTAMNGCGACVYDGAGDRAFVQSEAMTRGQSERLMPMIEELMGQAGLSYKNLQAIAVTVGPGAFTGLRIGLSTARALGLALERPVFGVTTLQVLAWQFTAQQKPDAPLVVLVESKREDFYMQAFDAQARPASQAMAAPAEEIVAMVMQTPCIFTGDAVGRFRALLTPAQTKGHIFDESISLPDPALIARQLRVQGAEAGAFTRDLQPVYLRGADVTLPKVRA